MDNREFQKLCKEHLPLLQRFLLARGASPNEVNDLVQETLVITWQKRNDILDGKARAFLTSTARNVLLAHKRKQDTRNNLTESHRHTLIEAFFPSHSSALAPHARLVQQERAQRLAKLIEQLSPRAAEVTRLIYIEGLSQAEAARHLRISRAAVSQTVRTALTRLRELAQGEFS